MAFTKRIGPNYLRLSVESEISLILLLAVFHMKFFISIFLFLIARG